MGTDLSILRDLGTAIQPNAFADDSTLKSMTAGGFLPYIQLLGGNSEIVKEGKFPIGHFALTQGKTLTDLTMEFNCINLAWRPKAMQFQPDVIACYNPNDELFKTFQKKADTEKQSGCGYGPEYLLWLPEHNTFATFFCGNITGRTEAPNINAYLQKAVTFVSHLIKAKKFAWHGPQVRECAIELTLPEQSLLIETINKFNNPPVKEAAEPAGTETQVR